VPFTVVDLSREPEERQERELTRRLREDGARPFDLANDVMLRCHLYRRSAENHVLVLTMHHIASDGWSIDILIRELAVVYRAVVASETPALAELPVQYADYSVWQREWLTGPVLERQLDYWRRQLEGAPPALELPADAARHAVGASRSGSRTLALSPELSKRLEDLGNSERATLFMTLLGAFQIWAGRLAGVSDVVVGTPIAGRTRAEVEGLIGFFVNTLVLRLDLSKVATFRDVLRQVRRRCSSTC
jgi:hypothetical protein